MDEYIKRSDALNASKIVYIEYIEIDGDGEEDGNADEIPVVFKRDIEAIPAADVRPVVHGRWSKSPECPEEYDICSVCGLNDKHRNRGNMEHPTFESKPPFCKWCGAIMDLEVDYD